MSGSPKAGVGSEIYLFPTVTVPPTKASHEHGLEPGIPAPDTENRTEAQLGILGQLREEHSVNLPIDITIRGVADSSARNLTTSALGNKQISISDLIKQVGFDTATQSVLPVPRFSVQFENDATPRGIQQDFTTLAGLSNIAAPAGFTIPSPTDRAPAASLVLDAKGRLLCVYLIEKVGGPDAGKHKIACSRFDQATQDDWELFVDENGMASYIGALDTPQVAAVRYRGDVYAIVSHAGNVASSTSGDIYVYRLSESTTSFLYVTGPVRVGTSRGVCVNGGIAAAALSDRVVVALGCYSAAGVAFNEETRTVWIGQSTDLRTWSDTDDNTSGFVALDAFRSLLPEGADGTRPVETVNRIRFHTKEQAEVESGWAVTNLGNIYVTADGGRTWAKQNCPTNVPLYDVVPASGSGDLITVYACGAVGAILKTTDSGETWRIISVGQSEAANLDKTLFTDPDHKTRKTGDQPLYSMAWPSQTRGWIVGENTIAFTDNGGGSFQVKKTTPKETRATYRSVVVLDETTDTILVGGSIQRERNKTPGKDLKRYRFVRIKDAGSPTYKPGEAGNSFTFHGESTSDSDRIERIWGRSPTQAYAVGRGGTLIESSDLSAATPTWTAVQQGSFKTKRHLIDLVWRSGADEGKNEFLVLTADGLLLRSVTSGIDWVVQHVGTETVGKSLASPESGVVIAGGGTGIWLTDLAARYEAMPSLVALRSGALMLATANLQQGRIDLRRSRDRGQTFAAIDTSSQVAVVFEAQTDFEILHDPTLRPSLYETDNDELHLTAGSGGVVCPDGRGDTWIARNDQRLALALGQYPITNDEFQNRSRVSLAYGYGRIFSIALNSSAQITTHTARDWHLGSAIYQPVYPGIPQWLGVDDLRIVFAGLELPITETWRINPTYRYPASNLVLDTRSQFWRSDDEVGIGPYIHHDWDRQHADVVAVMGPGSAWQYTAGALFGTNFRRASIAITIPSFNSADFPVDATQFIQFDLTADIQTLLVARAADGSSGGTPHNVLSFPNAAWIPSQFRAGVRQFYVEITNGGTVTTYKVLDNTESALLIDRSSTSPAVPASATAVLFGDRMFSDGSGGVQGGQAGPLPPLLGSSFEFGRLLRLTIPGQATAEGYRKIETLILGRHIPNEIKVPEGVFPRDRYDREWRWSPLANIAEERSSGGAVAIEHLSPIIQRWQLGYSGVYWFDRDSTLAPMVAHMRRAFALVFDDANPHSIELVRLASSIPEVVHGGADLFSYQIELEEVR